MATTRIPPLPPEAWSDSQRALVQELCGDAGPTNASASVLRYEELFARWYPFMEFLLRRKGSLPDLDRELVILRTAHRRSSAYQWDRHQGMGRAAGLTGEEIERVKEGADAEGWTEWQRVLLRAVDGVIDDGRMDDAEWAALSARYDERQLMETVFVVGHYWLLAAVLSNLDTPL